MANKKARVRKSAPTIRQQMEAAAPAATKKKPGIIKRLLKIIFRPFKTLHLSQRRPVKMAGKALRPVGKVVSWLFPKYLVNSWREVRQVQWTSRRETWRLTLAVFVFATVFGALIAGVDKGLDEFFKKVVLK